MDARDERASPAGWAALVLLAVVSAFAIARTRAPEPRGAETPEAEFSAVRALEVLRRVLGDEAPHPVGSEANARVRERIVAELTALDLQPSIETSFAASEEGVLAVVSNIVAFVPGVGEGPGILLSAHYDSVAAGPGAGDDGAGVASLLEIARALGEEAPARPVTLLFTDGEEAGLIGAQAFAARHDLPQEFRAVVNLEARGTEGPAYLFETSQGNSEIIRRYAASVPRPNASSIAYEIYERLPNDTDLTVFKGEGLAAANFAFIGGLRRYHTPRDDLAHLSPGSVQHIGEQALGLVRALALADAPLIAEDDAIYADVLGFAVVRWPGSWAVPLAIVALAAIVLAARRRSAPIGAIGRGALLAASAISLAILLPMAIVTGIELARGIDDPWAGHPLPAIGALVAGAVAAAALLARVSWLRAAGFEGSWFGSWTLLALAGLAAAIFVPGGSVLLLPPTVVAAVVGWFRGRLARAALPLAATAVLWVPLAVGLEATAELRAPAVLGAAIGVILAAASGALALLGTRWLAAAAGTAALASTIVALFVPSHTADRPSWLNLVHFQDADAGTARVFANTFRSPLPAEIAAAAQFSTAPEAPIPGARLGFEGYAASAESAPASPPSIEVVAEREEDGARTIDVHVASTRGARALVLVAENLVTTAPQERFDTGVRSIAWRGQTVERPMLSGALSVQRTDSGDWRVVRGTWVVLAAGPEGIDVRFRAPLGERAVLRVLDVASGLPPSLDELARARPANHVPRGIGDVSLVLRRVEL